MVSIQRMRPLAVVGMIVALDQTTKWIVRHSFLREGDGSILFPNLLDLRYVRNTGAAWGVLSGSQIGLIGFAIAMVGLLIWKRHSLLGAIPLRWLVLGLLIGGIVGNLIDRIWLGYVVDFIDCHWHASHFPAFNVADSSICCGVGLYMLLQGRADRRASRARKARMENASKP